MARRPPPAGDLLTWRHKPVSRRRGYGASRERAIPTPKETQVQKDWVRELRKRGWLHRDWRMMRPSGGDVPDAKWAGVAYDMGQDPGAADLLFVNGITGRGHFMEWKRGPEETLSPEQEAMRAWALKAGWAWVTVWSAHQAWKALQSWGALRVELKL
jgi:hypothetical protein